MGFLLGGVRRHEIQKNKTIAARIKDNPCIIGHHHLSLPRHSLHYVSSSKTQSSVKNSVVFVHGTPGGWASFSRYFDEVDLVSQFSVNVIDRPGWGESGYDQMGFPVSLAEQSRLIGPMLADIWQRHDQEKIILVGHSLGGSLVPKLAVDYPHYVKGVIVLAGDLDPALSEARWFNKVMSHLPACWFPKRWVNSNDEVMAIQSGLAQLQHAFAQISVPVSVLQGVNDGLVRSGSAIKAPDIFSSSQVEVTMLAGASHIINLTHVDAVKKAIFDMAEKTNSRLL